MLTVRTDSRLLEWNQGKQLLTLSHLQKLSPSDKVHYFSTACETHSIIYKALCGLHLKHLDT